MIVVKYWFFGSDALSKNGKNSASGCIKEKCGLQVCQKSILISKNVPCNARVCHMVDDIFNTTPSNKDGKTNSGDPKEHWSLTNQDMVSGEQMSLEQLSNLTETIPENLVTTIKSALCDLFTASLQHDFVGPKSSTCSSEIGTFFSPVLESVDFLENEGDGVIYVAELETEETQSYCEIQAFGVSDFCISDITFSGPVSRCNCHIDTAFPSDYECEESSLICDFKQDYMVLPFLEDVLDPERDSAGGHLENSKTFIDADNSNLYMANHLRPNIQVSNVNVYHNLEQDLFDPQMYIKMQPEQPDLTCTLSPTPALNEKLDGKRITLVLDLDETLVHSTLDTGADADFKFTVFFNEKEHVVYVKQRPHLQAFLKRVAEMFEVVVFTASQSIYAKQILDTLDPEGKIISRRAYRDSCFFSEGTYMKDLTIFGVDLARVAIVDNSPQVFRLQVNNGIPIKSWFDDPSDSALISLLPFLESLVDADDVRPLIAEKFGNKE